MTEPDSKRTYTEDSDAKAKGVAMRIVEGIHTAATRAWRPPPPIAAGFPPDSVPIYVTVQAKAHRTMLELTMPKVYLNHASSDQPGIRVEVDATKDKNVVDGAVSFLNKENPSEIRVFFQPDFYLTPDQYEDKDVVASLCFLHFTSKQVKALNARVRRLKAKHESLAEKAHLVLVVRPDTSEEPDLSVSTIKPTPLRLDPPRPNFMELSIDAFEDGAPTNVIAPRIVA